MYDTFWHIYNPLPLSPMWHFYSKIVVFKAYFLLNCKITEVSFKALNLNENCFKVFFLTFWFWQTIHYVSKVPRLKKGWKTLMNSFVISIFVYQALCGPFLLGSPHFPITVRTNIKGHLNYIHIIKLLGAYWSALFCQVNRVRCLNKLIKVL